MTHLVAEVHEGGEHRSHVLLVAAALAALAAHGETEVLLRDGE